MPRSEGTQVFFCVDTDAGQPVAFSIGSSSRTVAQGMPELLDLSAAIL